MRRVASAQQRITAIAAEQCMQRPEARGSTAARATSRPHAHRARSWFLVLLATLLGFAVLIAIWSFLPPSTVLGVTAQAQAVKSAEARAVQEHAALLSSSPASTSAFTTSAVSATATGSADPSGKAFAHGDGGSANPTAAAATAVRVHPVAAGSLLVREAQQQLKQQKLQHQQHPQQQQHQHKQHQQHFSQHHHDSLSSRRGSFRGGAGTSGTSPTSTTTHPATMDAAAGPVPLSAQVVVVGGGLAGLVAALQAAECITVAAGGGGGGGGGAAAASGAGCLPAFCSGDGSAAAAVQPPHPYSVGVLLVDKMPKLGGNSAKASSGINALAPQGEGDSEELFRADVEASGGGASRPELVEELVRSSPAALAFLEAHGVKLSGVTRLGGHSVPRTRTVSGGANVGWVLMSALMEAVKRRPTIKVLEGYALRKVITSGEGQGQGPGGPGETGAVVGVELAVAGGPEAEQPAAAAADMGQAAAVVRCGALVLATGGFAANKALLRSVAPDVAPLATTNGPWARGEALALAAAAGAALVGLGDVQVHPTGFVDPAEPGAGTKFLAPEKLRGVGGLLLNAEGFRFVDELARRDVVAAAMMGLRPDRMGWLLLGRDAGTEYGTSALEFYCKRGLMVKAESLASAAAVIGAPEARLREQLAAYLKVAARAQAAGRSTNPGADPLDPFGKRVFPHPPDPDHQLPLYLARVTPVVHYTMGGVAINRRAEVLRAVPGGWDPEGSGAVIRGLYAAGEVSGGLHGRNRLGGNSLLECAVFGRVAGAQAATCSGGGGSSGGSSGSGSGSSPLSEAVRG